MFNKFIIVVFVLVLAALVVTVGCGDEAAINNPVGVIDDPFGGSQRNLIVVISDLHLGANLEYAECNTNLVALENTSKQMK